MYNIDDIKINIYFNLNQIIVMSLNLYASKESSSSPKYLQLLSELIFGDNAEYEVRIFEYINEYSEIERFITETTDKITKSGVKIIEDVLILKNKKQCWIIKIDR